MSDLLDRYPLTAGTYHELLDDSGAVRAHWQRLLDHLQRSTPAQLAQRQAFDPTQKAVTFNVCAPEYFEQLILHMPVHGGGFVRRAHARPGVDKQLVFEAGAQLVLKVGS